MGDQVIRINDRKVIGVEEKENSEELVNLRDYLDFAIPSEVKGIENPEKWTDPEFTQVRRSVAEKLHKAQEVLQQVRPGARFVFTETRRSYKTQKDLFNERLREVGGNEDLAAESVSNPDVFSPHVTGGAVDVTLVDESGIRLDMGIRPDYGTWDRSDYQDLTVDQKANRKLLAEVMQSAGFVNYPMEWWHWSYGDKYWGFVTGNKAIYGPVV